MERTMKGRGMHSSVAPRMKQGNKQVLCASAWYPFSFLSRLTHKIAARGRRAHALLRRIAIPAWGFQKSVCLLPCQAVRSQISIGLMAHTDDIGRDHALEREK